MAPRRILVVDDEPSVCLSLQMILAQDAHQIVVASSGQEALSKYEPGSFDLVFVDFFMPGLRGDKVAAAIRDRDQHKSIVLISGFPPAGANPLFDRVLLKPFSVEEIRQVVSELG